jgi:hypothetical protein
MEPVEPRRMTRLAVEFAADIGGKNDEIRMANDESMMKPEESASYQALGFDSSFLIRVSSLFHRHTALR